MQGARANRSAVDSVAVIQSAAKNPDA